MTDFDMLVQEYGTLRDAGLDAKESVRRLGNYIKDLTTDEREELKTLLRNYESNLAAGKVKPIRTTQVASGVKPLQPSNADVPTPIASLQESKPKVERVYCWNCGKPNRTMEVICVHCGSVLSQNNEDAATRRLDSKEAKTEHYDQTNKLVMVVRHTKVDITVRPQDFNHEIIVGRSDAKGVVSPDIDLSPYGASQMGVSRMHLAISYDAVRNHLIVADMGSSNGVHINGQRLVSRETRVLRHGDQLRLGEMVVDVFYREA